MSNTLTTLSADMVQDEVLPALKLGLTPLNAMALKVAEEPAVVGDTILVPLMAARTATTYSTTFADATGNTLTSASITWSAAKMASWYVNPQTEAIPTAERFLASGREAAYAVAASCVQEALVNFADANLGTTAADESTITAANYDVDDQIDMWKLLKDKKVNGPISAIHDIAYAAALMKDNALQDRSASGSDVLMTGELPPIMGMRQFYTDQFPTLIGTTQHVGVIFTGPTTVAVALGTPVVTVTGEEAAAGVRSFRVVDPDTGISMIWRQWMAADTGVYWGSVYVMCNSAFAQDAAVRIVSA